MMITQVKHLKTSTILSKYGVYIAFVVMLIVLSFISPYFLKPNNILNVLRQTSVNGILAIGMTLVIITAGIDLSVGAILAFSAVVAASFSHPGQGSVIVPILMGLLLGTSLGFLNGLVIAKRRIAPFIVTLGMMTAVRGAAMVYTKGRPVIGLSDTYNSIGDGYMAIVIFVVVAVVGYVVMQYTRFGRHVYAVGGNELAAKVSGVNTNKVLIGVYAIAGFLSGLAGIVLSSRVMSGSPAMGEGYELDAIAAVVIGGTSLSGGVGTITGTVVGALIIGVLNNGLDLLNVSSYWQLVVKGLIIVLAVYLDKKKQV